MSLDKMISDGRRACGLLIIRIPCHISQLFTTKSRIKRAHERAFSGDVTGRAAPKWAQDKVGPVSTKQAVPGLGLTDRQEAAAAAGREA